MAVALAVLALLLCAFALSWIMFTGPSGASVTPDDSWIRSTTEVAEPPSSDEPSPAANQVEERKNALVSDPADEPQPPELQPPEPTRPREFLPATVLHVRDVTSKADLAAVTMRTTPDLYWSSGWQVPTGGGRLLATSAVSPITIRPWRLAEDDQETARGFELRHAGSEKKLELDGEAFYLPRGQVFFASTPHHAWGRVEIDLREGGTYELLCDARCRARISFENVRTAAYRSLERPVLLHVRRSGQVVVVSRLSDDLLRHGFALDGLRPGEHEFTVEIGNLGDFNSRVPLGESTARLTVEREAPVVVRLDDPPRPRERVPVSGTLTFPPFDAEEDVELRLFHSELYTQGPAQAEIELSAMKRIAPESRTWRFDAGALPTGRYQAKLWPMLVSFGVDVPASGNRDVQLSVPAIATLELTVRDPRTRDLAPIEEIFWTLRQRVEGMANHVGETIRYFERRGRFVLSTIPGKIQVVANPPGDSPLGRSDREYELQAGPNSAELVLRPRYTVRVVFRLGGAVLPVGELHEAVFLSRTTGGGRVVVDRSATEGAWDLSGPGRFRVSFSEIGPPEYRPVPERFVDVEGGDVVEVVVDLERP